jgi:chromosome segregation ATPase
VNETSLRDSNALLAAATSRTSIGEVIAASPAELARESGVEDRLSVARAVRALMSRGRIAQEGSSYRLLDGRPVEPGEAASVRRPSRRKRRADGDGAAPTGQDPTYEGLGRSVIERLIELSAEVSELRTALERARTEGEAARREAVEVTRRASEDRRRSESLQDEVTALKRRLEMTESNLRTVVEAANKRPSSPLEDSDARAILDILATKNRGE